MDIFKVLTRGTKQHSRRVDPLLSIDSNLPSANRPNPQLFHDDTPSLSRRKRKREEHSADDATDEELSDVDFFAPKHQVKAVEPAEPTRKAPIRERQPRGRVQLLEEDECRQLFRSHRLKLTILSNVRDKDTKAKRKKRKKESGGVKPKEERKQVFTQPLTSFAELRNTYEISARLAENLEKLHYKIPTEVQIASLPLLLDSVLAIRNSTNLDLSSEDDGIDFLAVAPTGSGKTLSFLIPAVNGIMKRRASGKDKKPHRLHTVVIAPTRELARQIANEGKLLVVGTGVRIVAMRKGMRVQAAGNLTGVDSPSESESDGSGEEAEVSDNEAEVANQNAAVPVTKADILVATPMMLLNFLGGDTSKTRRTLPSVHSLVLDEADILLDPLFREQTMGIWSACINPHLHVNFWSATVGSNIETLIKEQLVRHAKARETSNTRPLLRLVVGLKDTAVPNITHKLIYTATEPGKLLALRQLLHPVSSTTTTTTTTALRPPFLVFTQTIERATALHSELRYDIPLPAGGASRVAVLHSGLSDAARSAVVRRFRAGEIWVLVTTDVLARGIDFAGVNGVVNYDVPASAAAYVHRAGRTGRAGRAGGVAVTLYTKDDIPFVRNVANVIAASERQAGRGGEGDGMQKWLLDALPKVTKADRKKLKERGVESRRSGAGSRISSKSGYERRRENNRRGAIVASKRRKLQETQQDDDWSDNEWGGIDD